MEELNQRIDKWLWCARFFKSRVLAQKVLKSGKFRLNGKIISKSHAKLYIGDHISFPQGNKLREIQILSFAITRRPYIEAQRLYEDNSIENLKTINTRNDDSIVYRKTGMGRPTKRDRRRIDKFINMR